MSEDKREIWEKEWVGMPEFVQEDLTSHRKIVIHFRNDEDVLAFQELIGQKLTPKQKSTWVPAMPIRRYANKRYVEDES